MSKIIACYKWVVDEADIKVNSDQSIDISRAKWKISDYDKNAIEAAVQVAKGIDSQAVTLTFGNEQAKKSLKDALSRGIDEAYWINSNLADSADGSVTAKSLAAAIAKISDAKLIICAEGSSDAYARQTAPRIGAALDWPVITSVSKVKMEGNSLIATRIIDDCVETVKVEFPAVIAVLPEINEAPLPSLKAVIGAGKKPNTEFTAEELGIENLKAKNQVKEIKAYVMQRKNILFADGEIFSQVKELAASLKKEGVL